MRVLLLAHPRSGSSNLYEILQIHSELNTCDEPFNEDRTAWSADNKDYCKLVRDWASLKAVLDEIFTQFNGLKLLSYQLPEAWVERLVGRPDFRVLFVRRKNVLQAVVSNMVAEQTGLWHRWDTCRPPETFYTDLQPLDLGELRTRLDEMAQHLRHLETIIDRRRDRRIHKIVYEEFFFADPVQQRTAIDTLWAFLELDPITSGQIDYFLRPERSRLNSATTYRQLPNADQIESTCGDDETGHLF